MEQEQGSMEALVDQRWTGRRVFITGHTGFKGGWLSIWLARMGAIVRGYSLTPSTEPSLFEVARIGTLLEDVRGDIRDLDRLGRAIREFAPELVFHLAAQPLVRASYQDPLGTYATNVMGTANLLECLRSASSVRALVVITTDKCYQNHEWMWSYRENDRLGGDDPYSSSKACVEILTASYRKSFFSSNCGSKHSVAIATARAGNVIGGGDWSEDRLLPDLIRGFISGAPVPIRNPGSIRPWQHVLEPIAGYLVLADQLLSRGAAVAEAWNFGPPDEAAWTVAQIADDMVHRWGGAAKWVRDGTQQPREAHYLKLDASRAKVALGWHPRLSMQQTLQMLVDWYKAWQEGADMLAISQSQIQEYEKLLVNR